MHYYLIFYATIVVNRKSWTYLQFKQWKSWISQAFHENVNGGLQVLPEVRVGKAVAVKDVFQRQFCVDEHLVEFVAVVGRVVHLRKRTGKHFHLPREINIKQFFWTPASSGLGECVSRV